MPVILLIDVPPDRISDRESHLLRKTPCHCNSPLRKQYHIRSGVGDIVEAPSFYDSHDLRGFLCVDCMLMSGNFNPGLQDQFSIRIRSQLVCLLHTHIRFQHRFILKVLDPFKVPPVHIIHHAQCTYGAGEKEHACHGTEHTHDSSQLISGYISQIVSGAESQSVPERQLLKQNVLPLLGRSRPKRLRRRNSQEFTAAEPCGQHADSDNDQRDCKECPVSTCRPARNRIVSTEQTDDPVAHPEIPQKQSGNTPCTSSDQTVTQVMAAAIHTDGIESSDLRTLLLYHAACSRHDDQNSNRKENCHKNIGEPFMLCKLCCKTLYTIDGVFIDHNRIIVIDCFRDLCLFLQDGCAFLRAEDQLRIRQYIKQLLLINSFCKR